MNSTRLPDRLAPRLFVADERWGWEFRDPRPAPSTFDEERPVGGVVSPRWASVASTRAAEKTQRKRFFTVGAAAAGALAVPIAALSTPVIALAPAFAAAICGWLAWGQVQQARVRADKAHHRWLVEAAQQQNAFRDQLAEWADRKAEHDRTEQERVRKVSRWVPITPLSAGRIDVCGGSALGWESLLAATIGSLLGSGNQVTVLDLSQEAVTRRVADHALRAGYRTEIIGLPEQMGLVNLLLGLNSEEVSVAVSEAVRACEVESSEDARGVDADLLSQVCDRLNDSVNFTRLAAALRVVLRQPPMADDDPQLLSRAERTALSDLFGESVRKQAEPRLFRLAAALKRIAVLGGDEGDALIDAGDTVLQIIEVTEREADLTSELLRQLLVQILIQRVRREPAGQGRQRVLIVAGADSLRRNHVERLEQLARRRNIRLVFLFRHLRDHAVDLLGGGEAAIIMRMGNAKESEQAANFIGKEHRLVASQFTVSRGESSSFSTSDSVSRAIGYQESLTAGTQDSKTHERKLGVIRTPWQRISVNRGTQESKTAGWSDTWTDSYSESVQVGVNTGESLGYQRTFDYTITPKFLQDLSPTAFVLVNPMDPDSPRLGDCDPEILDEPGVGDAPPAVRPDELRK